MDILQKNELMKQETCTSIVYSVNKGAPDRMVGRNYSEASRYVLYSEAHSRYTTYIFALTSSCSEMIVHVSTREQPLSIS